MSKWTQDSPVFVNSGCVPSLTNASLVFTRQKSDGVRAGDIVSHFREAMPYFLRPFLYFSSFLDGSLPVFATVKRFWLGQFCFFDNQFVMFWIWQENSSQVFLLLPCFLFYRAGNWTQGLLHARQALDHWPVSPLTMFSVLVPDVYMWHLIWTYR